MLYIRKTDPPAEVVRQISKVYIFTDQEENR